MHMRPVALFAFLAAPALFAAPVLAAPNDGAYPVMAQTPSGTGDPESITCRAPQPLPTGGLGPRICIRNVIWVRLTMTGQDLSADGKSVFTRPTVTEPTGIGSPDAVTCRSPTSYTSSRVRKGPEVCLTNAKWKELADKDQRINNAGQLVSARPTGPAGSGAFPNAVIESSPPL